MKKLLKGSLLLFASLLLISCEEEESSSSKTIVSTTTTVTDIYAGNISVIDMKLYTDDECTNELVGAADNSTLIQAQATIKHDSGKTGPVTLDDIFTIGIYVDTTLVESLSFATNTTTTYEFTVAPTDYGNGEHTIKIDLDTGDKYSETDETDNSATVSYTLN